MAYCNFCGNNTASNEGLCSQCSYWPMHMLVTPAEWPISYGSFILNLDNFEYKGKKHKYTEIRHIDFDELHTKTYFGLHPMSESTKAELTLHMTDGKIIKEKRKTRALILVEEKDDIWTAKNFLSGISFVSRFNSYARVLKSEKYFIYDNCKFFNDGRIETRGKKVISLADYKIHNHDSFIELVPINPSILNKVGRGLIGLSINSSHYTKEIHGDLTIHATRDKDIFCSLMLRLYNVKINY
ncbi:hypothetical protein NP590_06990 [Methylomonas sp. SURF-2]|uniref:Uncharacterized protein n=1 Tax=Methylomonas subterranea TaxID=2952225 RepID=A0ABT1TEF9_9GAMM|nr:hypothetical protein [Methylomonas sp. SURF-2]MCQ8103844.1 hypothetical protein [Methylomonas sp. SURF-2]